MEITINILGLDNLSDALNHLADAMQSQRAGAVSVKKEVVKVSPVKEVASIPEDLPEEGLSFKDETKSYTLVEVREMLTKLSKEGKAKEVKALLTSFGAKNVTSLNEEDYPAIMEKAGEL